MDRVLIGKHDASPAIVEVDIIETEIPTGTGLDGYSKLWINNPSNVDDTFFVQEGDVFELPPLSDGTVQRVHVGNLIVYRRPGVASPYTQNQPGLPNTGTTYNSWVECLVTPILIDDSPITIAQAKNEIWGKKIKLISYTERLRTTDFGLYVSRPGANVLDPVEARSGNLAFDSSSLGTLKVLQRGTFQIQCKKTYMGKKGALELLSDEQNRANAEYTKLYPFEVPQQSEEDYLAKSPKNANTISLGYDRGQYPQTGNGFNQEFIQNVYCDYGTTTVLFDPPLPDHIKNPYVSLHFAVANSSGHFHPWYANVICTTGNEDYGWQYANSQHCVHMDTAWFRGKWSFRERTIAPFGTNLNNDFRKIYASANTTLGVEWTDPDGRGIPTFDPQSDLLLTTGDIANSYGSTLNPYVSSQWDFPSRPFDKNYGSGDGNAPRYMTENQLGFNLPRFANPTILPEKSNDYPWKHTSDVSAMAAVLGHPGGGKLSWRSLPYLNRLTSTQLGPGADTPKSISQTLLGLVDPVLFNAEPGDPGVPGGSSEPVGIPPEGAVKGTKIEAPGAFKVGGGGQTHGRVRPPYYDAITGKPRATSSGEGVAGLYTVREDEKFIGPKGYESTLSMNSPYGVWGGAFKSFAGMQGITYFANNTHLKIDAFMTPTHSPTPFETEIVKTREVNVDADKFDWLGANYLGDGTTPNQEFDEFGNIRKNVGLAVDTDQDQPKFKQTMHRYKRYFSAHGAYDGSTAHPHINNIGDHVPQVGRPGEYYIRDDFGDTESDGLGYSWSNVVHRAANSGYGLPYKEKLPRMFRVKYWDDNSANTEYEWWPINHANGHFTIAYGTKTGGGHEPRANSITAQINEYDYRVHNQWDNIWYDNRPQEYNGVGSRISADLAFTESVDAGGWLADQKDETKVGSDRSELEAQFLDESREMGFEDKDLKLYRGHPAYMAACYGDYRPIAFIGTDSDSAGGSRGKNFVLTPFALSAVGLYYSMTNPGSAGRNIRLSDFTGSEFLYDNTIHQLKKSNTDITLNGTFWQQHDQNDEWSPFWPLLNKGTRFSNQLPTTEGKGYPPNSQYEPGDAFLKTRTFQGQPTSLDSFWNSFSNNTSQWVSSNTPYGEFYYADGGYAMDVSPYYNYGGQRYIYSAEKVEQRIQKEEDVTGGGTSQATYRMMKLVPTDFNVQRQSMAKHNWYGGNPKAGVGTEGRRFGFGGAGSVEAIGEEDTFDTYIGTYVVYNIEGGGDS